MPDALGIGQGQRTRRNVRGTKVGALVVGALVMTHVITSSQADSVGHTRLGFDAVLPSLPGA